MNPDSVQRVEVVFESWGVELKQLPGAVSDDREAIVALVSVVQTGVETHNHTCGSRGKIRFHHRLGMPSEIRFLPGHNPEWYEFRTEWNLFRVPRPEFVTAMQKLGIQVPLDCQ